MPKHLLPLLSLLLPTLALAQAPPTTQPAALRLIPTPREVHVDPGQFQLTNDTPIVLKSDDPADHLAAQQIADEARTDLGLSLPITPAVPGVATITLERKSIDLPAEAIAEGYRLTITPTEVHAEASTSSGLFYAAQTIKQLLRANRVGVDAIPAVTIVDYPTLRYRGWQDDISRGPIPTLDYLKSEVRRMSEVKENFFTLYTEHVFKLKNHPDVAPPDGITADEVRDLSDYAAQYHIELAGNYQSFGHQAHLLSLPQYAPLGNGWAFKPANDAVYAFLASVYSEIATAYPSQLFCISCDEVGGFTDPEDSALIQRLGPGGFYAYHINRVVSLLKPYGKTPMMWGDIALQHPEDIDKLSRDLIVLPWTYGDSGTFDRQCKPWADRGYRFIVCPGVNCWNRIFPAVDTAAHNISDFTRDGHAYHTLGQLNTMWRDDGETLFGYCYYPLLWGAETAWTPVPAEPAKGDTHPNRTARRAQFDASFDGDFYGIPGTTIARANRTLGATLAENPLTQGNADRAFWVTPDTAAAADPTSEHARQLADTATGVIQSVLPALSSAKYNKDTLHAIVFAAERLQHMGNRVIAVNDMMAGKNAGQNGAASYDLAGTARSLRAAFTVLWNAENRNWWLDHDLAKYDNYIKSIENLNSSVAIRPAKEEFTGSLDVTLAPLSQGAVHYTLDNTDPTPASPTYSAPIHLTHSATIKAQLYPQSGPPGPVVARTYSCLRLPAHLTTALEPYEGNDLNRAFDGSDQTFFWAKGPIETNRGLIVHLDTATTLHHIKVTTGHPTLNRDTLESGEVDVQYDHDREWHKVADFKNGTAEADLPTTQPIKNIKVVTTAPQKEWLAIREVELN